MISLKLDKFIYKSNKFIIYSAVIINLFQGFHILFFDGLEDKIHIIMFYLICSIYFTILVLILYYFWKYRLELTVSMFIMNNIIYKTNLTFMKKEDFLDELFKSFNNFSKGILLLIVLALFDCFSFICRNSYNTAKKGLYDYRSWQEKWREKIKQGYYASNFTTLFYINRSF